MHWIKEHPYLTGGFVLGAIVLYLIFSSSSDSTQSGGATIVSAGTDPNAAGLQAAQLAAGTAQNNTQAALTAANNQNAAAVAVAQIQANQATQVAQFATQSNLQSILTGGQVATQQSADALDAVKVQTGASVSIAMGGYNRDITVAGIQGDTLKHQFDTALDTQKDIDATSLAINGQNTTTNLAALLDTNKTNLSITNSNNATSIINTQTVAGVYKDQIDTGGLVDLASINANYQLGSQRNAIAQSTVDQAFNARSYSDLKGGDLTSILASLFGQPSVGVAAQQQEAQSNVSSSPSSIISSIGSTAASLAKTIGSSLFGGAPAAVASAAGGAGINTSGIVNV